MKLSVIIPAHNEERYIEKVLERVFSVPLSIEKEIIVIDDGSSDNTLAVLKKMAEKNNFKLLKHEKNLGKGSAIKTGLGETTSDLLIIQDADMEYNPKEIPLLLSAMGSDTSAIYGKRSLRIWPKRGFHYAAGAKILTWLINFLYRANLSDVYTGYKLFNIKKVDINLLKDLKSSGFEFEAEVTCKILGGGGKIVEVPISYTPRGKKEGKHIGLKDAFQGFFTILLCFLKRNR